MEMNGLSSVLVLAAEFKNEACYTRTTPAAHPEGSQKIGKLSPANYPCPLPGPPLPTRSGVCLLVLTFISSAEWLPPFLTASGKLYPTPATVALMLAVKS